MSDDITPLPVGTKVNHYRIVRVLGGGGFSIVYLAEDLLSQQEVVVKEYFPAKLAIRDKNLCVREKADDDKGLFKLGRKLFFQEASILAAIKHPNTVKVVDFCQANGTVYTTMLYEKGLSLQAYLKRRKQRPSQTTVLQIFLPLLDALKAMHSQGLLHLDIKPGNIFLRQDNGPLLLDFGAVHKLLRSAPPRMFPVVTHGFSPPEQSIKNSTLGPWTDLYALGATIYTCLGGKPPIAAKARRKGEVLPPAREAFADYYDALLLEVVDWCLELLPKERPQTTQEVTDLLSQLSTSSS